MPRTTDHNRAWRPQSAMCPPSRRKSTPSSGTRRANQGQSPAMWLSVTSRARRGRAGPAILAGGPPGCGGAACSARSWLWAPRPLTSRFSPPGSALHSAQGLSGRCQLPAQDLSEKLPLNPACEARTSHTHIPLPWSLPFPPPLPPPALPAPIPLPLNFPRSQLPLLRRLVGMAIATMPTARLGPTNRPSL